MPNEFNHKCYKTKQDKVNERIVSRPIKISQKRWESIFGTEEDRLKSIKNFKKENPKVKEVDFPQISAWDCEHTYLATRKRMTKRQLKEYCKTHGKIEV